MYILIYDEVHLLSFHGVHGLSLDCSRVAGAVANACVGVLQGLVGFMV